MEGWKQWEGKKVFIILKSGRQYQGEVIEVEVDDDPKFSFIVIKDKYNSRVGFLSSEIELIQEEKNGK